MTFARFSRSASACRPIARWICSGRSTLLSSTDETSIPHGSVAASMIWRSRCESFSRSASSSSSVTSPSTERSLDGDHRLLRILHLEVHHRRDLEAHVVAGDHVLAGHLEHHHALRDDHRAIDGPEYGDQAWALGFRQHLAEAEDHRALVFLHDADAGEKVKRKGDTDDNQPPC